MPSFCAEVKILPAGELTTPAPAVSLSPLLTNLSIVPLFMLSIFAPDSFVALVIEPKLATYPADDFEGSVASAALLFNVTISPLL